MADYKILTINPGSTSTKIAVYENDKELFEKTLRHSTEILEEYESKPIIEQYEFRRQVILDSLEEQGFDIKELSCVVGRGGLLRPIPGGTYSVNDKMIEDLKKAQRGEHASNLGALLAREIGNQVGVPSFIVDPVVVDEYEDIARISGMNGIERSSLFHALNQKAVARKAASEMGKAYDELNFIVAHMGGGVSVGAHCKGRVIDANNALDGGGPFSPERSGGVPLGEVVKMCFSGEYTMEEVKRKIKGKGGLVSYLGTSDGREVSDMARSGDQKASLVYRALAYQVSKEIGKVSPVLRGDVDAIILTGGLAYDEELCSWIKERVEFIAPIIIYPGEEEMLALAEGGLRILRGEEKAKDY